MGKEYECCGQIIEVLRGEAINNRNTGMLLYAAMCRCNRNLLYIVRKMPLDRAGEDHVNDVLSHLYDIPQQYAMDCLAGDAPVDEGRRFCGFRRLQQRRSCRWPRLCAVQNSNRRQ